MRFTRYFLPIFLLAALVAAPLSVSASSKRKKDEITIRFHLQANEQDGAPFITAVQTTAAGAPAYVKKIPEINENDITAIYPFAAADGTMGCAYQLDPHGRMSLDTVSVENRGRVFVIFVNGRLVSAMLIDKRISDGVITIPAGLTNEEIDKMLLKYRVIGEPAKRPKKKAGR